SALRGWRPNRLDRQDPRLGTDKHSRSLLHPRRRSKLVRSDRSALRNRSDRTSTASGAPGRRRQYSRHALARNRRRARAVNQTFIEKWRHAVIADRDLTSADQLVLLALSVACMDDVG